VANPKRAKPYSSNFAAIRVIGFPFAAFASGNDGNFGIPQLRPELSVTRHGAARRITRMKLTTFTAARF